METNLTTKNELRKRKRIINSNECEFDMKSSLLEMFEAFYEAVNLFNKEIKDTPFSDRTRGMEASYFNSKLIQCERKRFGEDLKNGKYGRKMLIKDGYIVLFKKLNNKCMPMNIRTVYTQSISNQLEGNLFGTDEDGTLPIIFFGYIKEKFGQLKNPQIVYIDENKIKWKITEKDLFDSKNNKSEIKLKIPDITNDRVHLKEGLIKEKIIK